MARRPWPPERDGIAHLLAASGYPAVAITDCLRALDDVVAYETARLPPNPRPHYQAVQAAAL